MIIATGVRTSFSTGWFAWNFFDQKLISYLYSSCSSWRPLQVLLRFNWSRDEIWQDCSSNKIRIDWRSRISDVTISRWWAWRHFTQKSAAARWVYTQRLPDAYVAASVSVYCVYSISRSYCTQCDRLYWHALLSVCLSVCLSVRLSVTLCIVAKRHILQQNVWTSE